MVDGRINKISANDLIMGRGNFRHWIRCTRLRWGCRDKDQPTGEKINSVAREVGVEGKRDEDTMKTFSPVKHKLPTNRNLLNESFTFGRLFRDSSCFPPRTTTSTKGESCLPMYLFTEPCRTRNVWIEAMFIGLILLLDNCCESGQKSDHVLLQGRDIFQDGGSFITAARLQHYKCPNSIHKRLI